MSQFDSRNTPIVGAPGSEVAALPGTTQLLSALLAVPADANAALVQGAGNQAFAFRLDGSVGASTSTCLQATEYYVSNRQALNALAVAAVSGGASNLVVQFYTGRTGPAFR